MSEREQLLADCMRDAEPWRFRSPDDQVQKIAELMADKAELLVALELANNRTEAAPDKPEPLQTRLDNEAYAAWHPHYAHPEITLSRQAWLAALAWERAEVCALLHQHYHDTDPMKEPWPMQRLAVRVGLKLDPRT